MGAFCTCTKPQSQPQQQESPFDHYVFRKSTRSSRNALKLLLDPTGEIFPQERSWIECIKDNMRILYEVITFQPERQWICMDPDISTEFLELPSVQNDHTFKSNAFVNKLKWEYECDSYQDYIKTIIETRQQVQCECLVYV